VVGENIKCYIIMSNLLGKFIVYSVSESMASVEVPFQVGVLIHPSFYIKSPE